MRKPGSDPHLSSKAWRLLAASIMALALAGCAWTEADWAEWDAAFVTPAQAETLSEPRACESRNLAGLSKTSAALVGRADPHILEIARLEAERDCYKALELRARRRLEEIKLSYQGLK